MSLFALPDTFVPTHSTRLTHLSSAIRKPVRVRSAAAANEGVRNCQEDSGHALKEAGFMDAVVGLKMINMAASRSHSRTPDTMSPRSNSGSGAASPTPFQADPLDVLAGACIVNAHGEDVERVGLEWGGRCLLYTSPSPRDS